MINRLANPFKFPSVAPCLRPSVNEPNMDRKTRADIRREILEKLTARMKNFDVPGGWSFP